MLARGAEGHAQRINLIWLIKLRWVAVTGQVLTTLAARFLLELPLPLEVIATIIGVALASNVALLMFERRARRVGASLLGAVMAADVALLTALLYVAGGPYNPFVALYFVHVAGAAVFLSARWAWALVGLSLGGYGFLYVAPPPAESSIEVAHALAALVEGDWFAFGLAAIVIASFVTRVRGVLAARDRELAAARLKQARSEKLASLATLAAGAAHELSTPLSTIAVAAKELQRQLTKSSSALVDDAQLIREQVGRCRGILEQMSADAGQSLGELSTPITVREVLDLCLDGLERRAAVTLSSEIELDQRRLNLPPNVFAQALRGIVKNALDASPPDTPVQVSVSAIDRSLSIEVRDRGGGMPAEILQRVGEPFFTTKEPGRGMGLGVFLARAVAERVGGELFLDSVPNSGTTATMKVPLEARKT